MVNASQDLGRDRSNHVSQLCAVSQQRSNVQLISFYPFMLRKVVEQHGIDTGCNKIWGAGRHAEGRLHRLLGRSLCQAPGGRIALASAPGSDRLEGVRRADRYPNRSVQEPAPAGSYDKEFYDEPERETPTSEDCLYLNIWTPAESPEEKLPVAVWFHGGGFLGGFGHEKEFDGEGFCHRGVVLVTVNYRLSVMGFLAHPWLSAESPDGVSGNYGMLDQIAALQWVRENIDAFGGNGTDITAFGQSAGCVSVQALVTTPLTKGLISKAILQSGLGLSYDHTLAQAEQEGAEIAQRAGASNLKELRAMSCERLMEAARSISLKCMAAGRLFFTPVIDGLVLTEGFMSAMDAGHILPIPYVVGSTMNDIAVEAEMLARGERGKLYDACVRWCESLVKNGRKSAYHYYFTRQLPGDGAGAFHSSELWYVFETYSRCWRPMTREDAGLSARMADYWANFIKTGNPNGPGLPHWQPRCGESDVMLLNI